MGMRTGRPPKAIKQEKFLGFWVTRKQHFIIGQKAAQASVNISDYMRQVAIFGRVKTRWREGDQELLGKLIGMSNDLNRIADAAEKEGVLNAMVYFRKYRDRIDNILKQFSHDE
jgi:hypothetical protein